jgi:hypothetical protein
MEPAITRSAIRMLSALAAFALVFPLANTAGSAGEPQNTERELVDALQTMHRALDKPTFGEKFRMGSAAKKGPQTTTSIISGFTSLDR